MCDKTAHLAAYLGAMAAWLTPTACGGHDMVVPQLVKLYEPFGRPSHWIGKVGKTENIWEKLITLQSLSTQWWQMLMCVPPRSTPHDHMNG